MERKTQHSSVFFFFFLLLSSCQHTSRFFFNLPAPIRVNDVEGLVRTKVELRDHVPGPKEKVFADDADTNEAKSVPEGTTTPAGCPKHKATQLNKKKRQKRNELFLQLLLLQQLRCIVGKLLNYRL